MRSASCIVDLPAESCEWPSCGRTAKLSWRFTDFPAEHWSHNRTTNPIESVLATVRLRTCKTKGCGSRVACETMVCPDRSAPPRG
ncbi:MAG: hypothetical protein FJ271_31505 [Planctomycetes bacterium]|nr:hypothetical protein [Planctomycetota bacterium]